MAGMTQADAVMALYETLKAGRRLPVRDRPKAEKLAYHAEANRRSRARAKDRREANPGSPEPSPAMVRAVLADAALILLASQAPGSDEVQRLLSRAFPGRAGVAGTVTAKVRSGRLRPKVLTPDMLAS